MATINDVIRYLFKKQAEAEADVFIGNKKLEEINNKWSNEPSESYFYQATKAMADLNVASITLDVLNEIIDHLGLNEGLDLYD